MARFLNLGASYLSQGGQVWMATTPTLALTKTSGDAYEGAVVTYEAVLSKPWYDHVIVDYATSNGSASAGTDYTATSGTAAIQAGATRVTLSVPTLPRAGTQGGRTFTLTLSNAQDVKGDTLTLTTPAVTATILDASGSPSLPTISVANANANEGSALGFVVTATFAPTADVTFSYATSNGTALSGTDYTSASGTGTITAGTTSTTVSVTTAARAGFQGPRGLTLTISSALSNGVDPVTITAATATGLIAETEPATGNHSYWATLQADPAFVADMSRSLRSQTQLNDISQKSPNADVTYDPGADTYALRKDAAKVAVPPFPPASSVDTMVFTSMDDSQLVIYASDLTGNIAKVNTSFNGKGRQVKIDDEIVLLADTAPLDRVTGIIQLKARGAYGTTAAAHAAGARLRPGGSSLANQPRVPLGTAHGYTYLFTWDVCHTKHWQRCGISTYKTFQFSSDDAIWLEPQDYFPTATVPTGTWDPDTHVGYVRGLRSYNKPGVEDYLSNDFTVKGGYYYGSTTRNPLLPYADSNTTDPSTFLTYPDRWMRVWVRLRQEEFDYDTMDMWVADEVQDVFQVYSGKKVDVRGTWDAASSSYLPPFNIDKFWLEFNTSNAYIAEGICTAYPSLGLEAFRDLITYVKNFATLRWTNASAPSDISSYLVKPASES